MSEEDIDAVSRQAQDYYQVTPVIILGSGASSAFGMLGMWKLSQHLISDVSSDEWQSDVKPKRLNSAIENWRKQNIK